MSNIIRRRPIADLMGLRENMDDLFNQTFRLFDDGVGPSSVFKWAPAMDLEETANEVLVSAELPGMKKEDINIKISDNHITITGEIFEEADKKEKNIHVKERARGKFSRSMPLPAAVDANKTSATYRDGVLKVKLPKAEEAKPKEIQIND